MIRRPKLFICAALFAVLPGLVPACGGGSSGGSSLIQGLEAPSQVSVVQPVEEQPASTVPPTGRTGPIPSDSDYVLDTQNVYVYDPAIEPLKIVNEILCLVRQTAASQLVNEGPYLAQVNTTRCEQGQNHNSSGSETGQSSGANADEFQIWTVNSERASNGAPHLVQFWVPEEEEGSGPLTIFAEMVLNQGVGTGRPFGDFTLNFAGAADESGIAMPLMGGTLESSEPMNGFAGYQLFFRKGDVNAVPLPNENAEETAATVVVSADQQDGSARVARQERYDFGGGDSGLLSDEYLIAFDRTDFLRARNGGVAQAFKRNEFHESVWRYNLYYADGAQAGALVELNSGFGFRTPGGGYGWIGYWGMWLPEGVSVASGDTVTRDEFGQAGLTYTVVRAPGKLIRHTRNQLDLTELGGETFQWWSYDQAAGTTTTYVVVYDTGTAQWLKTGILQPGSPEIEPIVPPEPIDTAALGFLNMWSDSLGGPTAYIDGQTFITYYVQTFVNGSDPVFVGGDLQLSGLVQCLRPGITAQEAEMGNVYLPDAPDVATPYSFVFQQSDLTLTLDQGSGPETVGLATGEVPQFGPYTWGLRSGPLVASTAGLVNSWDVWNADEFYIWETGANPWNQFTGLTDDTGAFVQFDEPIRFSYVHSTANDRNLDSAFDGRTFFLNYGGPGQLWGLPQEEADLNGDGQTDRWVPVANLADGIMVGPTGIEYLVKAIDIEQTLTADPAYAGTLTLDAAMQLALPNETIYMAPEIGPEPVVEGAPRVIEGHVEGAAETP